MPASEINPAEALMAVMGLGPALGDEMPRVSAAILLDAARLPRTIAKLAKECVCGEMPSFRIRVRQHSWKKLHEVLGKPVPAHVLESIQMSFPANASEMANLYQTQVQNVHGHLAATLPVQEIQTFTGPKFHEPDDLSTFGFWSVLNLLADPLSVFGLVSNAAILEDQIAPFKDNFPTLFQAVNQALWDALAAEEVADQEYRTPYVVQQGLGVWLGRRTVAYDPEHGEPPPEPPQKIRAVKPGPGLSTSNQRATNASDPGT